MNSPTKLHTSRVRRLAVVAVMAAAIPMTASATTRVLTPMTGPFAVQPEQGDRLIFQTVATHPSQTRMDVTVTRDNGESVELIETECQINAAQATLNCLDLGSAPLTPIDSANTAFALDLAALGVIEWELTGPPPQGVRANWWGGCELEINDFSDCRNTCKDAFPGTNGVALTGIGPGCQLMCTCYGNNGGTLGTFPGNDTHVFKAEF